MDTRTQICPAEYIQGCTVGLLKWILKKEESVVWIRFNWLRIGFSNRASCKCDMENSVHVRNELDINFFSQLFNHENSCNKHEDSLQNLNWNILNQTLITGGRIFLNSVQRITVISAQKLLSVCHILQKKTIILYCSILQLFKSPDFLFQNIIHRGI